MVRFKTLRDWITFLEEQGDLVHNREPVDIWGTVSAISRKTALVDGPAFLHENVEGYPGWRVFTDGLTARRRQLWALDLPVQQTLQAMLDKLEKGKPAKPVVVSKAPCKEVKLLDEQVDLTKLPQPFTGELQPTPHMTAGISFIKDPETGWTNAAIRRFQIFGKNKLGNLVLPFQQDLIIMQKYRQLRKPIPIVIAIGADPVACLCSMFPAPVQFDEMDNFAALTGEPLKAVKCETVDIVVPASSEVIIEGEMDPFEVELEGPFPEFPGYYSAVRMCPVIRVKAMTMRSDAILQFMYMGVPPSEGHNTGAFTYEIELFRQLKPLVPEVVDVGVLSTWSLTMAVSLDRHRLRPGLDKKLGAAVKGVDAGRMVKNVFIVDDYVDVRSLPDVLWSFSVKFQPQTDFWMIPETSGIFLDPSETVVGPGTGYAGLSSYGVFNCLEKLPPYNEGFKRGLALPPREAVQHVEQDWARILAKGGEKG